MVPAIIGFCILSLCFYYLKIIEKIPLTNLKNAHPTSRVSPLWIIWIRYSGQENRVVRRLHEKHGPLIRLAPNEVSLACVEQGSKITMERPFEKAGWYIRFRNYNGSVN